MIFFNLKFYHIEHFKLKNIQIKKKKDLKTLKVCNIRMESKQSWFDVFIINL